MKTNFREETYFRQFARINFRNFLEKDVLPFPIFFSYDIKDNCLQR